MPKQIDRTPLPAAALGGGTEEAEAHAGIAHRAVGCRGRGRRGREGSPVKMASPKSNGLTRWKRHTCGNGPSVCHRTSSGYITNCPPTSAVGPRTSAVWSYV